MPERATPVNVYQFLHELLYAHVPCGEKIAKNPSAYWNHLKIHSYTANMFYQQTCLCACSNVVMSDTIFLNDTYLKLLCPTFVTHQEV